MGGGGGEEGCVRQRGVAVWECYLAPGAFKAPECTGPCCAGVHSPSTRPLPTSVQAGGGEGERVRARASWARQAPLGLHPTQVPRQLLSPRLAPLLCSQLLLRCNFRRASPSCSSTWVWPRPGHSLASGQRAEESRASAGPCTPTNSCAHLHTRVHTHTHTCMCLCIQGSGPDAP